MKKFIYGEPKPKFDDVDVPVIWRWVDAAEVYASDSDSAADPEADNENDRTLRSRRHQGVTLKYLVRTLEGVWRMGVTLDHPGP